MKLIGITGKSGAGKTTLSNIMSKNEDVGVIHVDELMDRIKEKNLSKMMEHDVNGRKVTVKKNIRKILYGNKYIFLIYIKMRGIILDKKINEKIEELKNKGKSVIVIECVYLKYYPIFKKLDKKVLVQRPYIERQESVLLRDKDKNMDKETFAIWDIPYKRSYYKEDIGKYDYQVENDSKQKLEQIAEEIYKDVTQSNERSKRKENFAQYKCEVKSLEKCIIEQSIEKRKEENFYEIR